MISEKMKKYFSLICILCALMLIMFSCEKKDDTVIDPSYNSPEVFGAQNSRDSVVVQASVIDTFLVTTVKVRCIDAILSVNCKVFSQNNTLSGDFMMNYAGTSSDSAGNYDIYSAVIRNLSCRETGNYIIQYLAQSVNLLYSNLISKSFYVTNLNNQPPVIGNLIIPDSVVRPVTGQIDLTLYLTAADPQGICNLNSVYFDAYRPTGSYIGQFLMNSPNYDSNFVYTAPVFPSTADSSFGYYRYEFQVSDNNGLLSNKIIDSIKFVRP